jgi:hypothetical protein
MARMEAAAGTANTKVLLHPTTSPALVQSSNQVAISVVDFHGVLGIERGRESVEARRWLNAAAEMRDKVFETGAEGVAAGRQLGNQTLNRAKSLTGRISGGIVERVHRQRGNDEEDPHG